ncbi:class I SAM-dependent methyltransferase [Hahella aquimaris]|uniref:class I SAM-dependent methyltransferase n=1 Tax=Hahella sp. HNIBRBA332 TaxID=3015983 RepID=UPI00273BA2DA|nr:class I SAM-dependent methyltransferase [Hahella sp. HNIBRBA332]WLQ14633.1 class I SAM-dependent methyltransferase [Hahella sp. HNIBRBA332]
MIREEIILERVRGKKVLDIGSVGQSDEYCLWEMLKKNTRSLTGVDLPNATAVLADKFNVSPEGYEHSQDDKIVYANMETVDLGDKYEVAVAGDVIEHVSNPGLFLDNIKKHLDESGELIITTPNAKWLTVLFKPNATHTLWHDIYTLKTLLERHGYKITYWRYYVGNKPHYSFLKRLLAWRQQILVVAKPM